MDTHDSQTLVEQQDDYLMSRHPEWYANDIDDFQREMNDVFKKEG